jgi:hypothetical protein
MYFHKGNVIDGILVEPEFELTSYLTSNDFPCSIKLTYNVEKTEDVITDGYRVIKEIEAGWFKVSFM